MLILVFIIHMNVTFSFFLLIENEMNNIRSDIDERDTTLTGQIENVKKSVSFVENFFSSVDCALSKTWENCMGFTDSNNTHKIFAIPRNEDEKKGRWEKSSQICEKYGATLVSIESEEKEKALHSFLGEFEGWLWTSGKRNRSTKKYIWMNNGNEIGYTNWNEGFPDNRGDFQGLYRDCIGFHWNSHITSNRGMWWNDNCADNKFVVCEVNI